MKHVSILLILRAGELGKTWVFVSASKKPSHQCSNRKLTLTKLQSWGLNLVAKGNADIHQIILENHHIDTGITQNNDLSRQTVLDIAQVVGSSADFHLQDVAVAVAAFHGEV